VNFHIPPDSTPEFLLEPPMFFVPLFSLVSTPFFSRSRGMLKTLLLKSTLDSSKFYPLRPIRGVIDRTFSPAAIWVLDVKKDVFLIPSPVPVCVNQASSQSHRLSCAWVVSLPFFSPPIHFSFFFPMRDFTFRPSPC